VLVPQAANLIKADPFAFLLAGVLDRGTKAEIIWTVPYYLKRALGHLDPYFFANASLQELRLIIRRLPAKPRYLNDAPRTVKGLSQIIMRKFDGKAERLWENRSSRAVKATLESIHGVGPGIASMIVLFLEDWFKVPFNDVDHRTMDVKPDVHVIRVFYRLGLISTPTSKAALHAARRLNASYPGALDAPAWTIGRKWCHSHNPNCGDCLMDNLCPKKLDKTI
jgi:endonuclease III